MKFQVGDMLIWKHPHGASYGTIGIISEVRLSSISTLIVGIKVLWLKPISNRRFVHVHYVDILRNEISKNKYEYYPRPKSEKQCL